MYALPDFNSFQKFNPNGECSKPVAASFQYPPSSSSPFLTLGSGFAEKPFERKTPSYEQNYRPNPSSYRNSRPPVFVRDPNKHKFSCDTCNRFFLFKNDLDKHIAQHVTCNIDGCSFSGHQKVVESHQESLHFSGLASLISKLNTPEEIKRWREERKKNFPTATNIKKRQEVQAAKRARGEVLGENFMGKKKKRQPRRIKNCGNWNRNNNRSNQSNDEQTFVKRRQRRRQPKKTNHPTNTKPPLPKTNQMTVIATDNKLIKFPGTAFIEMNDETESQESNEVKQKENLDNCIDIDTEDSDIECLGESCPKDSDKPTFTISDSEVEDTYINTASESSKNSCNTLSTSANAINDRNNQTVPIACEMNSDECHEIKNAAVLSFFTADKEFEDSEEEAPAVQKIVKSEPLEDSSIQVKVGSSLGSLMAAYDTESESKDETVTKPIEVQPIKIEENETKPSVSLPHANNSKHTIPYVSHRKLTLLEKLLANEIRHERNVIFQCITYIVKNNFFDKSN